MYECHRYFKAAIIYICVLSCALYEPLGKRALGIDALQRPNVPVRRRGVLSLPYSCPTFNGMICANNGYCASGRCLCFPGFTGDSCGYQVDNQKFDIDCTHLQDQYMALAIHETTVGACPQYRLVWSILAQRTEQKRFLGSKLGNAIFARESQRYRKTTIFKSSASPLLPIIINRLVPTSIFALERCTSFAQRNLKRSRQRLLLVR